MEPERVLLDLPAFLIIPQEERRKAWERWDAMGARQKRAPPMQKAA
jgi:hypothetical protein